MNTSVHEHKKGLHLGTAVMLALVLPLAASQVVAQGSHSPNMEQTTTRAAGRDGPSPLRFPAQGRDDRSVTVSWGDLDLSRPAGLEQLYLRLSEATATVCSPREDIRNLALHRERKACLARAMDRAVSQVGYPALEELHASRTGRDVQTREQVAER